MKKENVVVLLYPGCISYEVSLAAELLSRNFQVINASPDGHDLQDASGLPLKVNLKYADVNLEDCKAILVPGGNPESIITNKDIDNILFEADKRSLVIAAICAGPVILSKAGILKGKKIAHGYEPDQIEFLKEIFQGVTLTNEMVVAEGNILTAKAEAHIDFAVEVACRLNVLDASKSGRIKEYYKGTLGRKIRPLALALIKNNKNQILLHKAFDSVKNETFYRPLGGGIDFYESGKIAVEREIEEELNLKATAHQLVATFENIFVYEGIKGHEIVMLYNTEFADSSIYDRHELDIVESGQVVSQAVWRSLAEIQAEGSQLYPNGIERVLS